MKLRTRLFLILLSTSLVPLLIFSSASISSYISKSRNDTYQLNEDKLEIAKAEIKGMLEKNLNTLHIIASQPDIRNFDLDKAKTILEEVTKVNSDLIIALADVNGQQVVKSNADALVNVSDRDFFKKIMSGAGEYVSDIIVAKDTGKLIVVISAPVLDANNNVIGLIMASTELTMVSEFVTELSENGSNVYVLSRQGTVLAHPNSEYVMNQDDYSSLDFVQAGLTGASETLRTKNINGEDVIVSYSLHELSGWLIVVETPNKTAMLSANRLLYIYIAVFFADIIIVASLGLYYSKKFTKPLVDLSAVIKTIAGGDLNDINMEIRSKDEIGELYQNLKIMNKNLRELVGNIQTVASTIASHSLQLSTTTEETTQSLTQVVTTINEMAQGNGEQAVMVQESTNAITKVNNIVSDATSKTEVAAAKAKESLKLADEGQKVIEHQSQKIEENNRYTKAVGDSIRQLASMADEIHNIIGVINSITEQTNLLALNASIEAARAGEAGRGFAVVAEEIRKLAEQSKSSTKKVEDIVNDISSGINDTVNNMLRAKESVGVMEASAEDTKKSFAKLYVAINELAQIAGDISVSLEEIQNKTRSVTDQAMNISAVVEEAAASMEEISASSEEQLASMEVIAGSAAQLEKVSHKLLDQVQQFRF